MFGTMKSGKSGIQYRHSEATGLGYYLVMQKNQIATWRQVKRSIVESSTAARQLNTRKIMQSPLLIGKDRTQTHIDYQFFILYYEQPIVSWTHAFQTVRTTTVHTTETIGTRHQSLDTKKGSLQISIIRRMNLPLEHRSANSRNRSPQQTK